MPACLFHRDSGGGADSDAVEQFYKGKQISVVVGSSAGGGYDTYARLLARRFGSSIPGNPTVVPQNMPGAGSNLASYIYSVAPKDGTAIGAIFSGAILQPLLGDPVQHDPSKFIYLGNANNEVFLCLARTDAPVKSFAEALDRELIVGATNEGGSTRDFTAMLDKSLGAKLASSPAIRAATRSCSRWSATRCRASAGSAGRASRRCSRIGSPTPAACWCSSPPRAMPT